MNAKVTSYSSSKTRVLHVSNVLVFLLTWANAVMGGMLFHEMSYKNHLKFYDCEIKTGIQRTSADLQWFCIESWIIPMLFFLAYPILATVFIHVPRIHLVESEGRELAFLAHAVFGFIFFSFLFSVS
jgi:sterol desaturase/sphingolipid hydroxylase (fatty acid hydroxylase superfamily)